MNRSQLKIIACLCMLADHIAYLLLPQLTFLRWIGRLAMPIFAFFIGEGCRYTKNRKQYLLRLSGLAAVCQAAYLIAELAEKRTLSFASDVCFLNILFTFSLSCPLCFLLLDARAAARAGKRRAAAGKYALLLGCIAALALFFWFLWRQRRLAGWETAVDSGLCGVLLPVSAVLFDGREEKLFAFSLMLLIYCFVYAAVFPYVWFALLSAALLALYNGKPGSRKLKYGFYAFYPAHLGVLYLISLFL